MQTAGQLIKENPTANFLFFRESALYYQIGDVVFPVPISDTNGATFKNEDKSIFFMRWLRKHLAVTGTVAFEEIKSGLEDAIKFSTIKETPDETI